MVYITFFPLKLFFNMIYFKIHDHNHLPPFWRTGEVCKSWCHYWKKYNVTWHFCFIGFFFFFHTVGLYLFFGLLIDPLWGGVADIQERSFVKRKRFLIGKIYQIILCCQTLLEWQYMMEICLKKHIYLPFLLRRDVCNS